MAFMMPVMKNNYDIFKDSRSRKTSECSNGSGGGHPQLSSSVGAGTGFAAGRTRKVSECKSESFASSPNHHQNYRMQMQRCQSSRAFSRTGNSSTAAGALSPTRSFTTTSPTKATTAKINTTTTTTTAAAAAAAATPTTTATTTTNDTNATNGSQNDLSKFHLRLVEKLRKSFRKDNAKRS